MLSFQIQSISFFHVVPVVRYWPNLIQNSLSFLQTTMGTKKLLYYQNYSLFHLRKIIWNLKFSPVLHNTEKFKIDWHWWSKTLLLSIIEHSESPNLKKTLLGSTCVYETTCRRYPTVPDERQCPMWINGKNLARWQIY